MKNETNRYKEGLKNRLSERRYVHSAGVAASAYILAEKYGYNPKKRNWPVGSMTVQKK